MNTPSEERGPLAWMVRNPVAANLLMAIMLVGGLVLALRTKQEVFPEFDLDVVQVLVPYPGASPEEVEKGIVRAIESELRGLDNVKRVRSRAFEGLASVEAELLPGADRDRAVEEVKNVVNRLTSLPAEAERPIIGLQSNRYETICVVVYGDVPEEALRELGERAREGLLKRPGITLATLAGVRKREISIEVPQAKLRLHNLTLDQIAQRVAATSLDLPGGGVKTPTGEVLLRTSERRDTGAQLGDVSVLTRPDGTEVRLREIARIVDGFEDSDEAAFFDGKRAVMVRVFRVGKQRPLEIAREVKKFVEEFRPTLPPGVQVGIWGDWSEIYHDRMKLLLSDASVGLILVLLSLGLFLDVRVAFWVMMGVPTAFLGSFLILPLLGVSINMISLFAYIMALGIVLDDTTVVGENIYMLRKQGMPFIKAAIVGTRQVIVPVSFSTLTNMVAFVPLFFIPGAVGKIFWTIPAVVLSTFAVSFVECFFCFPAHIAHQRRARRGGLLAWIRRRQEPLDRGLEWFVERIYGPVLRKALDHRYTALAAAICLLLLTVGFIAGGRISVNFLPHVESEVVLVNVVMPYGTPREETEKVLSRLVATGRETAAEHGGPGIVRGIYHQVGALVELKVADASGSLSLKGGHLGTVIMHLTPSNERKVGATFLAQKWRERFGEVPGIESLTFIADVGPATGNDIQIELSHDDARTLESAATELAAAMRSFRGMRDIDDGFTVGKPQLAFKLTPEAQALGLTSLELGRQVRSAFHGAEALRLQRGRDEIKVMVRLPKQERRSEFALEEMIIRTPNGGEIPLREAATIARGRAFSDIQRVGGRRVLNVTANTIPGETTPDKVVKELESQVLPQLAARYRGLEYRFEGRQRELGEVMGNLTVGFVLALIAIFALLAVPLKSYLQTVFVLSAVPFGVVGAVIGHWIMGQDLSVMSMMGVVALSGVVVNHSLVLIHATNEKREEGLPARAAVEYAGMRRLRPIMLAVLTTFLGLGPMIFEKAPQAMFLIPMSIAIGYGELFSVMISLLLIPALYLIAEDVKAAWQSLRRVESASDAVLREPESAGS